MVYVVKVYFKKGGTMSVSQIGYRTLEGAMRFVMSRSDYSGQPFDNWRVETPAHIYEITDVQITD